MYWISYYFRMFLVSMLVGFWILDPDNQIIADQNKPRLISQSNAQINNSTSISGSHNTLDIPYTQTNLIPTKFEGEDTESGTKKKTLTMLAITIDFDEAIFQNKKTDKLSINGVNWYTQTEVFKKSINESKAFDDYWIFPEGKKLTIVPLIGQKDCTQEVEALLYAIKKLYRVNLIKKTSK